MNILFESETPWVFELGCFLTDRDLTYSDATEVIMLVKNSATDADASALVTKQFTLGEIAFVGTDALSVSVEAADYGSGVMEIGGSYHVYIGFTFTGYPGAYLEARLKSHSVTILQDGVRA